MAAEAEVKPERAWAGTCPRTAGCIKPASHKGACKVACMEEEDYEVEKVMAQRSGRGGRVEYQVKWVGWPLEDCTWEPVSALADCQGALREWELRREVAETAAATGAEASDSISREWRELDAPVAEHRWREWEALGLLPLLGAWKLGPQAEAVVEHSGAEVPLPLPLLLPLPLFLPLPIPL